MFVTIAFVLLVLLVLLRPVPAVSTPRLVPATPPSRRVSFSRLPSPPQRPRFVNPFARRPSEVAPDSPRGRRTLANKVKSVFKSVSPRSNIPVFAAINTKLRRRPVARTQPYGPPWNAPMPVPDSTPSRRRSSSRSESSSLSPGQLSPRTFVDQLDEKLYLLHQQRIHDSIPSR